MAFAEEEDPDPNMAATEVAVVALTVKVPVRHHPAVGDMERNKLII